MGEQNITNQYEVLKIVAEQNQEFIMEYEAGMDTMQVYKVENGEFVTAVSYTHLTLPTTSRV